MKCLQLYRRRFILIQEARASRKNVGMSYPVVVLNLANRIYLHQPSVLTSIGSLDLYED